MEKYSKAVSEMYSQFKKVEVHTTEKYSKAVSEMYSQFKKAEVHPMEKYIGRHVRRKGRISEIVGYDTGLGGSCRLIADASETGGWTCLVSDDVVFKKCKKYRYVSINDLID